MVEILLDAVFLILSFFLKKSRGRPMVRNICSIGSLVEGICHV
jgi:hypothetical protein